jgi:hypothetical protein
MPYPRLSSSLALTEANVLRSHVRTSAGVYVLGPAGSGGSILPAFVGRSDIDLVTGLKQHIGKETHFAFAHCSSELTAFKAECALFHHLKPPKNKSHPMGPIGCPYCPS